MTTYCPICGRQVSNDVNICPYCGQNISDHKIKLTQNYQQPKQKEKSSSIVIVLIIIFVLLIASIAIAATVYVYISGMLSEGNNFESDYTDDPGFKAALENTIYPVAVLETSKGVIAVELYNDQAPETCENFIKLVNDDFYDGMIFHRVMDDFMIQAGNMFPDGSTKTSPYGYIDTFEGDISHVNGAISMASTGAGVTGSSQFFICDGPQTGLDGSYAVFGKTIYGIEVVQDIADDPHDSNYGTVGGGRPYIDIIIEKIYIA